MDQFKYLFYEKRMSVKDLADFFNLKPSGIVDFRVRNHLPGRGWAKPPWQGKKRSQETIDKIRKKRKGRYAKAANPNWKGGKYISHGYAYVQIAQTGQYAREHRLVAEQFLGRKLSANEIVHHVNGNKQDNRPENLIILNRSEHGKHHFPIGSLFGIHQISPSIHQE